MTDHVAELPPFACGRGVPARWLSGELEHLLDLPLEHIQQTTFARGVQEVPRRIV